MEIIYYDDTVERSCQKMVTIDYQKLSHDVEKKPEDYVFLLTPDEYSKYCELNRQIKAGLSGRQMNIDEQAYMKQYQGVFIIVSLAATPQFAKRYKIADMTKRELIGDNHVVFYIDRRYEDMERANQVLRRIADLKDELPTDASQQN